MSAWIVSKGHIDVLVNGLAAYGLITPVDMNAVGQELWAENHASVNYRYDESTPTPHYSAEAVEAEPLPHHLIAAVHCYDYQSCEHPGWDQSRARKLVLLLEEAVIARHPDAERGWDKGVMGTDYHWGYESVQQALVPLHQRA